MYALNENRKMNTSNVQKNSDGISIPSSQSFGARGSVVVKVAGSITDEVIFLNLPNPSDRTRPWGLLSL
jgi:hypothetical protein